MNKLSVITRAWSYCKNCRKKVEMEIMELNKSGVMARCTRCGSTYLLPINLDEYFKGYQKGRSKWLEKKR